MPGEGERRPAGEPSGAATPTTKSSKTIRQGPESMRHGSRFSRWRHFDCNRRRREHAELVRLCSPASEAEPSTFGLGADELRRHANHLVLEQGWSVDEVCAALDVEPVIA
jgi:hypothetical protein